MLWNKASRTSLVGGAALALIIAAPSSATAYCIANTCSVQSSKEGCGEVDGCKVGGESLHWNRRCISFSVQQAGSPLRGISVADARRIIGAAFYQWTHVECGDGQPALDVFDISPISCGATEFELHEKNANIWVFRDVQWPYDDVGTLALTTVTFDPTTGEIHDSDVEVNTAQHAISIGDDVAFDLASIATHEAGHVLGLAHSNESASTMYYAYGAGSAHTRWLHLDDVQGICTAIRPDREVPSTCDPFPATGFSDECHAASGCLSVARRGNSESAALVGLMLAGLGLRRVRRARRPGAARR